MKRGKFVSNRQMFGHVLQGFALTYIVAPISILTEKVQQEFDDLRNIFYLFCSEM